MKSVVTAAVIGTAAICLAVPNVSAQMSTVRQSSTAGIPAASSVELGPFQNWFLLNSRFQHREVTPGEVAISVPGTFVVQVVPAQDPRFRPIEQLVRSTFGPAYQQVGDLLGASLTFQGTIPIVFQECRTINAFWDPEERRLTMCYELLDHIQQTFAEQYPSDSHTRAEAVVNTTTFLFYHELGHALVTLLDLPATGRGEDVADQVAMYLFTMKPRSALYPAIYFLKLDEGNRTPFYDEHALGPQRFYNIICWIYGSDPSGQQELVTSRYLPQERAPKCPAEYQNAQRSWTRLLTPFLATGRTAPTDAGQTLTLGMYTLQVPSGVTVHQLGNGGVELEVPGQGKVDIAPQPALTFAAASTLLPEVAQRWNPQAPLEFVNESTELTLPNLGGSGAYRPYQQNLVDRGGPNVVHGVFFVHVRHAGQGLAVDVFANGPARDADWNPLMALFIQTLRNLQVQPRQ